MRLSAAENGDGKWRKMGVRTFGDPVEFRPGVGLFYFYGPDGEVCELRQS